jgi:uncharacterized NAD(P)/FAD-binding protein YdhS
MNIDSQANIAILGSSLTAIDILVLLHWNTHQGNITLFSRNANLPSVRDAIVYNSQSQLQPILDSSLFRKLSLTNQLNMILDYCMERVLIFNTTDSPKTQLENDLVLCESGKNQWQNDMIYLIDYFDHIWSYLDHNLKHQVSNLLGRLKRFMGAMPKVNGYKILNLFDRQQLKIEKMECKEHEFKNKIKEFDFIFNAIGLNENLEDNILINKLIGKGIIKKNSIDGITICPDTLQVSKHIYAIGALTKGDFVIINGNHNTMKQIDKLSKQIFTHCSIHENMPSDEFVCGS